MACPHQPMFSCDYCIIESIRKDHEQNGRFLPVFERLRNAQKEIKELRQALKEIARLSYDNDFSVDENGEGVYNHKEIAELALAVIKPYKERE
jgi:hypothetical protein